MRGESTGKSLKKGLFHRVITLLGELLQKPEKGTG